MQQSTLKPPMRKPQRKTHVLMTLPAPTGGLDTVSPLAAMPPQNAVELDNMLTTDSGLALREGWYEYATGLGGPVRTLMSFDSAPPNAVISPLTESELFACTDDAIRLIEGGGDVTGEPAMIALSGATYAGRFQSVHFTTNGGTWLVACSETDGAFLYDGVTWIRCTQGGGPGPGVVSGADPSKFVHVVAWKKRLIFVERASTKAWILQVNQVGGSVSLFDFGPLLGHGGVLLALLNWTQDAGAGVDDMLVVLGSAGDLAVYEGTDPTTANTFRNIGVWYLGQMPVGRRNFTTSGGNVYILCQYGLVPVSQIVQGGLDSVLTSDTEMLRQLRLMQEQFRRDFLTSIDRDGWEVLDVPAKVLMMILRPSVGVGDRVAYAYQMHTNAWSRLLDIPMITAYQRMSEVYAGTDDGRVLRILDGHSDQKKFDGSGAVHVRGRVTPAFNYMGDPTVIKHAVMCRAVFLSAGDVSWTVDMNSDFYISTLPILPIEVEPGGALWDHGRWNQSYWAPALAVQHEWRHVAELGYALTPSVFVSSQVRTTLTSVEHMIKPGGPL